MTTPFVPLVETLGGSEEPVDVAGRFLDLPYLLFLDSAAAAPSPGETHPLGRYSFLTADPALVVRSKGKVTEIDDGGGCRRVGADPLAVARELLSQAAAEPVPGIPPFQGGMAGYIGYDFGAVLERLPHTRYDDLAIPDVILGLYDWVIAWDHRIGTAWIISTGLPAAGPAREKRARERMEEVRRRAVGQTGRRAVSDGQTGRRTVPLGKDLGERPDCPSDRLPVLPGDRPRRRRPPRSSVHLQPPRISRRGGEGPGVHPGG